MSRVAEELKLLTARFKDLEFRDPWILLPQYAIPSVGWAVSKVCIAFPVPAGYPGQKPYGFHVSPVLRVGPNLPGNATESSEPPFAGPWLKFSWDSPEWAPAAEVVQGSNLFSWALSFVERLKEYS
jgi:hypothetical protein